MLTSSSEVPWKDVPSEIIQETFRVLQWMLVFYLVQPFVFRATLSDRSLRSRLAGFGWYAATMYLLSLQLRAAVGNYYNFNLTLLWWPHALLTAKYLHAVSDAQFYQHFCFTPEQFLKLAVFCYFPPTIIFTEEKKQQEENGANTSTQKPTITENTIGHALYIMARGVLQMVLMSFIAFSVLKYDAESQLPWYFCNLIKFYQLALSMGGFADLFFNGPTILFMGRSAQRVIFTTNIPALTVHARHFWYRWSTNVGYHLRYALYEPAGGYHNQFLAAAYTFGVNALLHALWWGPISADKIAWGYLWVLFVGPLTALWIDKLLLQRLRSGGVLLVTARLLTFQTLVACLIDKFLDAQGMPTSLTELALIQTGQAQG
jgi:branched-subunit amino acid transport protein